MNHPPTVCFCGTPFAPDTQPEGDVWRCQRCGREYPVATGGSDDSQPTAIVSPPPAVSDGLPPGASGASPNGMPARLGPYRLEAEIGKGGMGTVYRARDEQLGRPVAVKTLTSEYRDNPDFFARFQREARAAALINHRNIVQIYYTGVQEGIPFFGMEFVPGRNLEEILHDDGPLDTDRAVDFMIQAAEGLRAAAARGVIHRDIKPTNLLVLPDGTLKIADFGLAKSLDFDSRLTMTGAVVGTPFYMSPEQGRGDRVDHRSDIYALGSTFYHLLCGEPPFESDSPVGIILKHINETPPPLRSRRAAVSPALATIIARMMAKDPANRYADYDELIADLAAARAGRTAVVSGKKPRGKNAKTFILIDAPPREIHLKRSGVISWTLATSLDLGVLWGLTLLSQIIRRLVLPEETDLLRQSALAILACTLVYFTVLDARGGLTVGKAFFRLRLGDPDGEEIGLLRSFVRFVLFMPVLLAGVGWSLGPIADKLLGLTADDILLRQIWFLSIVYGVLDLGYGLLPGERRALHDVLTGTYLFRQLRPHRLVEAPASRTAGARPPTTTKAPTARPAAAPMTSFQDTPTPPKPPPLPPNRTGTRAGGRRPLTGRGPRANPIDLVGSRPPPPRLSPSQAGLPSSPLRRVAPSPQLAAVLSIVPGLGQVYNGQFFRGISFFLGTLVLIGVGFGFLIWAWSVWHAYETARRQLSYYDRVVRSQFSPDAGIQKTGTSHRALF